MTKHILVIDLLRIQVSAAAAAAVGRIESACGSLPSKFRACSTRGGVCTGPAPPRGSSSRGGAPGARARRRLWRQWAVGTGRLCTLGARSLSPAGINEKHNNKTTKTVSCPPTRRITVIYVRMYFCEKIEYRANPPPVSRCHALSHMLSFVQPCVLYRQHLDDITHCKAKSAGRGYIHTGRYICSCCCS